MVNRVAIRELQNRLASRLLAARTEYPCRRLILVGAILINADHDVGSFAEVRRLHCVDLPGRQRTDLLPEFMAQDGPADA